MAVTAVNASSPPNTSTSKLNVVDENYQDFLRLLTTQLQHQDPTDPTDTNQLTQQIATLSQVEQQLTTNKKLEQLISLYGATQYNSLVSYIGKQIEAPGATGGLHDGQAIFAYYAQQEPEKIIVKIKDSSGQDIFTVAGNKDSEEQYTWRDTTGGVIAVGIKGTDGQYTWKDADGNALDAPPFNVPSAGRNEFVWNGKNGSGQDMPNGSYTIAITAKDASDNSIVTQTYTTGIVTSVDSSNGQVYLSIGEELSIPLEVVSSIRQPHQPVTVSNTPPPANNPPPVDDTPPDDDAPPSG